jgi:hypothetical protein
VIIENNRAQKRTRRTMAKVDGERVSALETWEWIGEMTIHPGMGIGMGWVGCDDARWKLIGDALEIKWMDEDVLNI